MYVIAGLGNPGPKYENTRHNTGFIALDAIAKANGISVVEKKHKALVGKGVLGGNKVVLVKPQTFMNLSGESLREVCDYYKVDPSTELIVLYDDIALEVGKIRIRGKGSAGGHNGMKNIIAHLSSDVFPRIRIGVGEKPAGWDLADYVLGTFKPEEKEKIEQAAEKMSDAIACYMERGIDIAMNRYNGI